MSALVTVSLPVTSTCSYISLALSAIFLASITLLPSSLLPLSSLESLIHHITTFLSFHCTHLAKTITLIQSKFCPCTYLQDADAQSRGVTLSSYWETITISGPLLSRNKLDVPNAPLPHSLLCPFQVHCTLYENNPHPRPPITSVDGLVWYFAEKIGANIQQLLNCSPWELMNLSVYTCSFILLIFLPLFWILFPLTFSGSLPNIIFFLFWTAKVSPIFFLRPVYFLLFGCTAWCVGS